MTTSVFFTNNYIRVIVGKAKGRKVLVKKACSCDIPEGCLINGLITDEEGLTQVIKELWEVNKLPKKGVRISTESSRFTLKTIQAPQMKGKKMREFVMNEFPEVDNPQDMVFDYQLLSKDNKTKLCEVMGVMTERELVESFVNLFKGIGVSLESMTPSRCALIEMVNKTKAMGKNTSLLLLVEGHDLRSTLYVEGKYAYATKSRLFSERGTEALAAEIAKGASEIQQFIYAQKLETQIENVYVAGVSQEEQEAIFRRLLEIDPNLKAAESKGTYAKMPKDVCYGDYLSPVADLIMGKEGPNLMGARKSAKDKEGKGAGRVLKTIWPVLALFVALASASGVVLAVNHQKEKELKVLVDFNTDPENLEKYAKALALEDTITRFSALISRVREFNQIRWSYPWASTEVMGVVEAASGQDVEVKVVSYNGGDGSFGIIASAYEVTTINHYIDALEATGVFDRVTYTGYTLSQREEREYYSVNASCYLAADAGK